MAKTREYQALLHACTQQGCPLCRMVQESTRRFLDAWKYELFTDVDIREELRRTRGFCHTHTWQLVRMGASLPLAQAYRDILSDTMDQIKQTTPPSQSGERWRRFFGAKNQHEHQDCPACKLSAQAEERYIYDLRKALLDDEFTRALGASAGLCLEHFRQANEMHLPEIQGDWQHHLRQAQLACLERLDTELGELIRKHDYRFHDEERGPEMHSWRHAAGLVGGEEIIEP